MRAARHNKLILLVIVLLIASFTSTACVMNMQPATGGFVQQDERMKSGQLIAAIAAEPEAGFSLATGSHSSLTNLVFSSLFKRDANLAWTGDLAKEYGVSPDGLTWQVVIRNEVNFSDGSTLRASDVAFTFNAAKEAAGEIDLSMLEEASAPNDYTVEFKLNRPYSAWIERMAYVGIVPEASYNEDFKDAPIGSGPFKLLQWDKGQQMIFEANDFYYGSTPKINRLTLVFLEKEAAAAAIEKKDIDLALIDGTIAKKDIAGAKLIDLPSNECYGIAFPMQPDTGLKSAEGGAVGNDVTADLAIRRALNLAIDRQAIVDRILGGFGSASTTGLEGIPWENADAALKPEEYGNRSAAKALLAEAGWADSDGDGIIEKDGLVADFTLLYVQGTYRQDFALAFQKAAQEIGIKVVLEQTTWDTIAPEISSNAVLYGFGSGDPSELYSLYYGGHLGQGVIWDNSGWYKNAAVDTEIDAALSAPSESVAIPHWKALQEYASPKADAPYCWLVNANHVYLAAEHFNLGTPNIQPHGGRIFDNVLDWAWD